MKNLIIALSLLLSFSAFANVDLNKLSASWSMSCTQSQTANGKQGFMIETYTFDKSGSYQRLRQWYKELACKSKLESDTESGSIVIGKENTNNGFNPAGTYEVEYKTQNGVELGLLWVNEGYTKLRIARGFGTTQNTMLGVFEYNKK